MWKRRAEIAALALLVALAGGGGYRPHVHLDTPAIDVAGLVPDRVDTIADVGMVALAVTVRLID